MLITYRRTGGRFVLLLSLAAALAAMVLAVALGVALLIGGLALGAVVLLVRAVLPASRRRHTAPPGTPWPQETIEATAVNRRDSCDEPNLLRIDSGRG